MALSSYYVSQRRKDLAEKAIVAKRERDAYRTRKCNEVASYHQELALKSSKYKCLEEAKTLRTPRIHEESCVQENIKAAVKEKVELRRQKLAHLLAIENDQYMKELGEMKEKERDRDPWNICKLKQQIEELQRKRKEAEQHMQQRYMRHTFTPCGPVTSEEEDASLQKEVVESWNLRKEEIERLNLEKQQREQEKIQRLELEKQKASKEAEELEILQMQEQEKWSNLVQNKVNQLNAAESDSKKLKTEKHILVEHLKTLHSLQHKRETVRDIHRKAFQKIQLMWQAREKLRRMLNEVKQELEFDLKLLNTISNLNNSVNEDTALALLDLDDVANCEEKIQMQIALEKKRELEIQQLYHEEASEVWEKKKEQWILESFARDDIINELVKSLVNQINKKIDHNIEEAKTLIEMKEHYLSEIDDVNLQTKNACNNLIEKQDYYVDQTCKLNEELESLTSVSRVQSANTDRQVNLATFYG